MTKYNYKTEVQRSKFNIVARWIMVLTVTYTIMALPIYFSVLI